MTASPLSLLVVGAGSTGGYFGARLAAAGRDVTFLVRPARAQTLERDGLRVVSPHGDLALQPALLTASSLSRTFDAVLLTVKAFHLDQSIEDMAPAVGPDTMILPVLNGMSHVDALIRRFGSHAVAGCACKVAAMLDGEGRVIQMAPLHELTYGELDGRLSARIGRLDEFMRGAGFDAILSTQIEQEMWNKWVLLSALGSINCLSGGSIGEVAATASGAPFSLALLAEVVAIVVAEGHPPSDEFLSRAKSMLTAPGSAQTSSMFRDMQAGQRIEATQIVGDLLARGLRRGLQSPLLNAAFTRLAVYERQMEVAGAKVA